MVGREKKLLENALDALDRLFDQESSVIDVWALLFATGEALRTTEHHAEFEKTTAKMLTIVKSKASTEAKRDSALVASDDLRHYLARALPIE